MRLPLHERLQAAALLLAWLLPGALALGLGLHLLHHHHDPSPAEVGRLLAAVGHGHAHLDATPDHDHQATLGAAPTTMAPQAAAVLPGTAAGVTGALDLSPRTRRPPGRASPPSGPGAHLSAVLLL